MRRIIVFGLSSLAIALIFAFVGTQAQQTAALPSFAEPAISPDRAEIAFVSGGDIWTAPAAGGEARLLVAHPANESRPVYSPDGRKLAFVSTRTGGSDIYVLTFATGDLKRMTFEDGAEQLSNWSRDGRWIYYHSTSQDVAGMSDLFRVGAEGGTPMALSADRYVTEGFAAPSTDENVIAFTGNGFGQWWRHGHSHIDESEIWLRREGATPAYEKLSEGGAKETWAMWSQDGRSVYYVSDRSGAENIWVKTVGGGGAVRQVTKFKDGRLMWPNISGDGKAIVFERNFRIWRLDPASGNASEVPIAMRGAPIGPGVEHLALNNQFQELSLAPDGRKVAFTVRGEIFAAAAKEGGDAARVTKSLANDSQVAWAPDSKRLVYASERDGAAHLYLYDFATRAETRLTNDSLPDSSPRFSPDGKLLAFIRDGRELRVMDMANKSERALATGYLSRPPFVPDNPFAWSPDNKWIAYLAAGDKSFRNVFIVPASGGEAKQASFLANVFGGGVAWSPDGTFILFGTNQRTETGQVARIDLLPRTPRFREDQFRDLFREQSPRPPQTPPQQAPPPREPAADKPAEEKKSKDVEIVFEGIRQRLSLLPVGVDVNSLSISPDGKVLLLSAVAANQFNLYTYSLDELAREPGVARQLTSTPGFKADAQFSPDGKEVYFLEQGRIASIAVETRQPRAVAVTAEMDVDFAREKMEVFAQGWSYLRDYFYDPKFHGADWNAVRQTFEPQIAGARTPDEMRRLMSLMVGELNASHLGVTPPGGGGGGPVTGKLGLRFDRAVYERDGKLKITEVIALGPAALTRDIKVGDFLIAVDGTTITARTNLDELLAYKVNRRVELTISNATDGSNPRTIAVRPVNTGTEKGLLYRQWVNDRRAYVARASQGRLGYVHMVDMSAGALQQLYLDLDAENHTREGVVIDVRNNNGGFVNVYAIDVFARRPYLQMTVRGQMTTPARTMLGQRSLEAPTILVTNRYSLSDAEDFTEGYRALGLGKVVGEPTAGWIIYTTNITLIDGSGFRIPFIKIADRNGVVMELNPRPVDLPVTRPIGEGLTGRDSQLDAAIRELEEKPRNTRN